MSSWRDQLIDLLRHFLGNDHELQDKADEVIRHVWTFIEKRTLEELRGLPREEFNPACVILIRPLLNRVEEQTSGRKIFFFSHLSDFPQLHRSVSHRKSFSGMW